MSIKKVAIIHDWLLVYAGAERVLEQMLICYPEADIFSVVDFLPPDKRDFIQNKLVVTSFIQHLPFAKLKYRSYLPLMPLAVQQFDLSGYDLIISSSHAVAKGVLTGPDQLHISYVHSPIRYAWDLQHQYLKESNLDHGIKGWLAKWFLHKIRIWDYSTAAGVDYFVANSKFVRRRINKVYRRDSDVIYPPVDVGAFDFCEQKEDFFLTASRLVPYKRMDLIVRAFVLMPDKRLVVIGDGPEMSKLRAAAAAAPNVSLLGFQEFDVLKIHLERAKAFVFAAEEDFGITPVEAQACGTPVIAFGKGGALETVVASSDATKATGVFFTQQTVESLIAAVRSFDAPAVEFMPNVCRANAEQFSIERFRAEFSKYVDDKFEEFRNSLH